MAKVTYDDIVKTGINTANTASTNTMNTTGAIDASTLTARIGKTTEHMGLTQAQLEEMSKFLQRGHEAGLINDTTNSSVVVRHNGQINLSASIYTQYKLNPSGKIVEHSLESVAVTNRRKIATDDMIINEHKLNPYLYQLTDMKKIVLAQNDDMIVGNFCVMGTVLVKSWEKDLKRYVLIRRPARIPLFSPVLNVPSINPGLEVSDPLTIDEEILAKSSQGYQVNQVVTDSDTLIGKEGRDRAGGTNRNPQITVGEGLDSSSGSTGGGSVTSVTFQQYNISGANEKITRDPVPSSIAYAELANQIGELSGCNKRLCWAQMYHETDAFGSELLMSGSHNYAGVKRTNASQKSAGMSPEGNEYRWFDSDSDYAQYQGGSNLKAYARLDGLGSANTASEFAQCLQHGGYFTDNIDNYIAGLVRGLSCIPKG